MKILFFAEILFLFTIASHGQVTAQDGTVYKTVKIGKQTWMAENLSVNTYRNGDTIPEVSDPKVWSNLKTGAWCYYGGSADAGRKYGKLYNWYAVNDPRGLAAPGWHVPSDTEWNELTSYLGGASGASLKIKSTDGWSRGGNGTNETGFGALPAGTRSIQSFSFLGNYGYWWTATEYDSYSAWNRYLGYNLPDIGRSTGWKTFGNSVRCVKDDFTNDRRKSLASQSDTTVKQLNLAIADAISVGSQVWMLGNLHTSTFRNGDPIPQARTDSEWVKAGRLKQPAWCYYENDSSNENKYGRLYNWYAVNDKRGLAPAGWHVPGEIEWNILVSKLGGESAAGTKIKSGESGLKEIFTGFRDVDAQFHNLEIVGYWWSSTETSSDNAQYRSINYFSDPFNNNNSGNKAKGFSVRCIKD